MDNKSQTAEIHVIPYFLRATSINWQNYLLSSCDNRFQSPVSTRGPKFHECHSPRKRHKVKSSFRTLPWTSWYNRTGARGHHLTQYVWSGTWNIFCFHTVILLGWKRPIRYFATNHHFNFLYFVWSPPRRIFRHIFRHSIWHIYTSILSVTYILTFYLTFIPTLPGILSDALSGSLSGIWSGILFAIFSDIIWHSQNPIWRIVWHVSGILDGITVPDIFSDILYISGVPSSVLSDILSAIWCGILSGIRFDSLSYILGHVVWQWVRVRQGPGGWGACNRM